MKRTAFLVGTAAVAAALAGCAGPNDPGAPAAVSSPGGTTSSGPTAPARGDRLLATTSDLGRSRLRWVDARTLEPVDGRSVGVPFYASTAALSPNHAILALGEGEGGTVQFVDVERMRALGTADVDDASYVDLIVWAEPRLVLASLGGTPGMVAAIDPSTGEVVSMHDLGGATISSEPAGKELVSLVAPTSRIGPARLVVFEGRDVRDVTLAEVPAGWAQLEDADDGSKLQTRQSVPALAVNEEGTRALVIPAGGRVADVDLDTMEVRYHDLSEPVSLWGRLRDWLEPAAHAKAMDGPDRNAVWLPNGLVAVSGAQYTMDGDRMDMTPAGLVLIDPSDWSVRRVSDEPSWVTLRGGALLASVWNLGSNEQKVIVFDEDGQHRFTLAREATDLSQTWGSWLYATSSNGTRFEIVDLESGKTVGRATPGHGTWLLPLGL
jgi:hypothetical protein